MNSKKEEKHADDWAAKEFGAIDFGDKRLTKRLIQIADRLSEAPQSPINQACGRWAETKAAYRFFQNETVCEKDILSSHVQQTVERTKKQETILVIQDTSYVVYTSHEKTTGLGMISAAPGKNVKAVSTNGLIMHTSFAVTTEGLPIGLLDQNVFSRKSQSEELKEKKKRSHNTNVAIEDKESIRWLNALKKTQGAVLGSKVHVVTVCDREGDFYEFLEWAHERNASVLVRAREDRKINQSSRYCKTNS